MKKPFEDSKITIYETEDGQTRLQVKIEDDTVWLTQDQMAELFQKAKSTINEHIKNIYEERELTEKVTTRKFGISEFSTKPTNGRLMKMTDWIAKLDEFLKLSERMLLTDAGSVSAEEATRKAGDEFEKYKKERDKNYISDFDNIIKKSGLTNEKAKKNTYTTIFLNPLNSMGLRTKLARHH